ncbi:protein of unknown function [Actinopolyspora mzabensis]|uniref:DUF397 domain-containing protein n=1 Tax=Actinopolyspora mzabensis TaxID=995066 RepID=A0A1G8X679_ACTMZ|nr:DUF397 domain-containing protein [Actinopolyspora mzabensis]SDJ85260.1 protein of unknown function [Actinopolyspora mzabensis]
MNGQWNSGNTKKWHKSSYSATHGQCVEVSPRGNAVWLRNDSPDDEGPVLVFEPARFGAFLGAVKAGRFDHRTDLPRRP